MGWTSTPRLTRSTPEHPLASCRLASTQSQDVEYECGLDELLEELLAIKGGLLGMGERVRRQEEAAGGVGVSTRGSSQDSEA